jgi:chromate transporter
VGTRPEDRDRKPSPAALPAPVGRSAPRSPLELYLVFNRLALQGFGGVLAVAQIELVERTGWLTRAEFVEALSVAQVLPGPNVCNLALMTGDRFFGWRGAVTALAGMMLVPLLIVLVLAAAYGHWAHLPAVSGALRGMGAVAAGLVIATALKLARALKANPLGLPLCLAFGSSTFVAIALARLPLVWVVCALGSVAITAAWSKLR